MVEKTHADVVREYQQQMERRGILMARLWDRVAEVVRNSPDQKIEWRELISLVRKELDAVVLHNFNENSLLACLVFGDNPRDLRTRDEAGGKLVVYRRTR